MLSEVFTSEMIVDSLLKVFLPVIVIFKPLIIAVIASAVVISIVKRSVYSFERFAGSTQRQAKKKANFIGELIDLVTSFNRLRKGGE